MLTANSYLLQTELTLTGVDGSRKTHFKHVIWRQKLTKPLVKSHSKVLCKDIVIKVLPGRFIAATLTSECYYQWLANLVWACCVRPISARETRRRQEHVTHTHTHAPVIINLFTSSFPSILTSNQWWNVARLLHSSTILRYLHFWGTANIVILLHLHHTNTLIKQNWSSQKCKLLDPIIRRPVVYCLYMYVVFFWK